MRLRAGRRPAEEDEAGWGTLLSRLDRIAAAGAGAGLKVTLHPHVGTMVETRDEVHRVLDGSGAALSLDTGHLLIGGTDPAELARQAPDRIGSSLESSGYTGWYVMEQDTILSAEPVDEGPLADVRASVAYLRGLS